MGGRLEGGLPRQPAAEPPAGSVEGDERALVLQALHGLDNVLRHQGAKLRRKAPRVHAAGVALKLWPHAQQRPREVAAGRLLSCAIHRRSFYGPLVSTLEGAAGVMRKELLGLLRRAADGDAEEVRHWYPNQERITARASDWMQRHVSCERTYDADGRARFTPRSTAGICAAVTSAMGWYYGEGASEGMPPPGTDGKYWGGAMLSVLGPGTHVKPHTGPNNERVVFSLGLAGGLDESELRVAAATRRWRRGGAIVFDDSLEHEVRVGNATGPRAVLILHAKHPQLMPVGTNGRSLADDVDALTDPDEGACEEGGHGLVEWVHAPKLTKPGEML